MRDQCGDDFLHCAHVRHRLAWINFLNGFPDAVRQRQGRAARSNDQIAAASVGAERQWSIDAGPHIFTQATLPDVPHDSHDFPSFVDLAREHVQVNSLAKRVLIREVLTRQGFIDDHDARRIGPVAPIEGTAFEQWSSRGAKIVRAAKVEVDVVAHIRLSGASADLERGIGRPTGHRHQPSHARKFDPGKIRDLLERAFEKGLLTFGVWVFLVRQRYLHGQNVEWIDAGWDVREPNKAVQEQTRSNQQNQLKRHFRDNQSALAIISRSGAGSARAFLKHVVKIRSGGLESGHQTKPDSGKQ